MLLAALVVPQQARAGALGKVIGGLTRASDNDDKGSKSSGSSSKDSSSSDSSSSSSSSWSDSGSHAAHHHSRHPEETVIVGVGAPYPQAAGDTHVDFYLGAQSVADSDGSLSLELGASHKDFGIRLRGTSFYERAEGGGGDYLRLDMWGISVAWRAVEAEPFTLWIEGGAGGLDADVLTMAGVQAGVRAERRVGGALSVGGAARMFWLEDHVFANEVRFSLRASIVQVSYRIVDFNVGPPLMGPELGVFLEL